MATSGTADARRAIGLAGRLSALAADAADAEPALVAALAELCAFTGCEVGHVVVVRRGDVVGTRVWHGADDPALETFRAAGERLRLRSGEGLAGRVLSTGKPAWVEDLARDPTFARRGPAADAGIRAALAFPLLAGGDVVGVVELFGRAPGAPGEHLLSVLPLVGADLGRMVERSRTDERLRASEHRYRLLFESASDAILVGDRDGNLTSVNPAACRLLGYSEEELVGKNGRSLCAPEWLDLVDRHAARKAAGEEEAAAYEMVLVHRTGTRIPVEARTAVLRDGDEVVGAHAVIRDISARKRAEEALRESEERFRGAFDAAAIGMALCAVDGRWLKVNRSLCELVGYDQDELLQMRFQDVTHPDDIDADLALVEALFAGEIPSYRLDKRYVRRDGRIVPIHLSVSLVRDAAGAPAYSVAQILSRGGEPASGRCPLTAREREVLALLAGGETSAAAAERLGIGDETVQTHVRRAMRKLPARTRTEAVAIALSAGWLEPDALPVAS